MVTLASHPYGEKAMILRFFRVVIHDGGQAEFKKFFLGTALPGVRSHQGLISMSVGLPRPESPAEFSMSMVWKDMDALKGFTGENWQKAVIHPDEAHLLREAHVHHYDLADI
jgi:hypothetical protein